MCDTIKYKRRLITLTRSMAESNFSSLKSDKQYKSKWASDVDIIPIQNPPVLFNGFTNKYLYPLLSADILKTNFNLLFEFVWHYMYKLNYLRLEKDPTMDR